jgi:hypothetical protein
MVRQVSPERKREIRSLLKAAYDAVAAEPVPQSMHDQLKRMP